jgi:nucleobase:cation symporter-1, NCS1 family
VRRARYDVGAFFLSGSTYGNLAWRGLLAYVVGLAAEWPFVSQPDYTGFLVKTLGGADISWLVGWFVAAGVYLLAMRGAVIDGGGPSGRVHDAEPQRGRM